MPPLFNKEETLDHPFLHCPFVSIIWSHLSMPIGTEFLLHVNIDSLIRLLLNSISNLATIDQDLQHSLILQAMIALDHT